MRESGADVKRYTRRERVKLQSGTNPLQGLLQVLDERALGTLILPCLDQDLANPVVQGIGAEKHPPQGLQTPYVTAPNRSGFH